MAKYKKMLRSFKNYLDSLNTLDYEDLKECIDSDIVWDDGYTRRNPTSYELFATHEHLDFAKEDIFKFSGIALDLEAFEASASKVEEIWQKKLPELFPSYEFIIHKDRDHRQVAFCRKRTGVTEDPAEIISHMTHEHHNVRWNALLSANLFPNPILVPHILERLDDDDIYNILKALIALGETKDEGIIPELKKRFFVLETGPDGKQFINDFFAYDLFRTLIKLGEKGYREAFELFKNYRNLDIHTLEHLCELLGNTGRREALDLLLDIYFNEPEACDCALTGLLNMAKDALPEIIPRLADADPAIRKKAMWFVARCYVNDARSFLLKGLKDKNKEVREAAVFGIGRFYHRTRKPLLRKSLEDNAASVRIRAIEALGNLFDPKLLPTFQILSLDPNTRVRHEAMRAVAALDSKEGVIFLSELYDQVSRQDKLRIIDSLYAYTGKPAYLNQIVSKALSSNDKRLVQGSNGTHGDNIKGNLLQVISLYKKRGVGIFRQTV